MLARAALHGDGVAAQRKEIMVEQTSVLALAVVALASFVAGANAALFLGWLFRRAMGIRALPLWLFSLAAAALGVSFFGAAAQGAAFALGAGALGLPLLLQDHEANIRQIPPARRVVFNIVVALGVGACFSLPAIVASMAISFALTGAATPLYGPAALAALAVAGAAVLRTGRLRRAEALAEDATVVEAFE